MDDDYTDRDMSDRKDLDSGMEEDMSEELAEDMMENMAKIVNLSEDENDAKSVMSTTDDELTPISSESEDHVGQV